MVRVTLHLRVRSGREKEFEKVWIEVAAVARHAPGILRQMLLRDIHDPACYVISSDWVNAHAFSGFERSAEQDELTAPIRALRESGSMSVYEVLTTVDPVHASSHDANLHPATRS